MSRILLAEDDQPVRAFVKKALEMDGHSVVEAEDGGLALDLLGDNQGNFDLLLSDIRMPIMDGIALGAERRPRLSAPAHPADDRVCRPA